MHNMDTDITVEDSEMYTVSAKAISWKSRRLYIYFTNTTMFHLILIEIYIVYVYINKNNLIFILYLPLPIHMQ
jgi:hypothetical protein